MADLPLKRASVLVLLLPCCDHHEYFGMSPLAVIGIEHNIHWSKRCAISRPREISFAHRDGEGSGPDRKMGEAILMKITFKRLHDSQTCYLGPGQRGAFHETGLHCPEISHL